MKNKYTFATYFKQKWLPIITGLLEMILSALLIIAIITFIFKALMYLSEHNLVIFYSIIALAIILVIIYLIYDNYKKCKREYYENYQERKKYYDYQNYIKNYQEENHEK